ncbi:peptidase inhibitor family I36 protein [Streptomyces sp. NBC_00820]|uniref:peptidase inhibitor family I36 protein n=1 Tax=Streptomyces sp. NBC_00820 TaxID=2975842 RepID=UPI002ED03F12|nr:peptidase inhibitor family I36 protein [Streptomyces sp. NBC_00820]
MRKRIAAASVVLAVAAGCFTAPAAFASTCSENYGFELYYNSNEGGSSACFYVKQNFAGEVFTEAGAGQGQPVKNNAASADNWGGHTARVFYNSNYVGLYDDVQGDSWRNLADTYNNNASWERL